MVFLAVAVTHGSSVAVRNPFDSDRLSPKHWHHLTQLSLAELSSSAFPSTLYPDPPPKGKKPYAYFRAVQKGDESVIFAPRFMSDSCTDADPPPSNICGSAAGLYFIFPLTGAWADAHITLSDRQL